MTSQKDDLVDRRKVEAWQHVEPKRTNRGIAFLCPNYRTYACIDAGSLVDLTSNRCSNRTGKYISNLDQMGINYTVSRFYLSKVSTCV